MAIRSAFVRSLAALLALSASAFAQSAFPQTAFAQSDDSWWEGFGTSDQQGLNAEIFAMTVYDSSVIVGGWFTRAGSVESDMIARWDGRGWHSLGGGIDHIPLPCLGPQCRGKVFALTAYRAELIAGGNFITVDDGTPASFIAAWDGSTWRALGEGVDHQVHCLTVWRDKLVAGGHFTHAGGRQVNRIATWDGHVWEPLKTGLDGCPLDLTVYQDDLIAVGAFKRAGVLWMNGIARWDGSSWHALGDGVTPAFAVCVHNGALISNGLFIDEDGFITGIARWTGLHG